MKILLAEDDSNIATIIKLALESVGGHDVTHSADGESALNNLMTQKYDLVLLDEMMPKMNGHKVCQHYTSGTDKPSPVIIMSANPQDQDLLKNIGSIGSISKPFEPMKLNDRINEMLKELNIEAS